MSGRLADNTFWSVSIDFEPLIALREFTEQFSTYSQKKVPVFEKKLLCSNIPLVKIEDELENSQGPTGDTS